MYNVLIELSNNTVVSRTNYQMIYSAQLMY